MNIIFHDDRPTFHAAALVTHYRHEHLSSWDRAWQNRRYAAKIPHYDYDLYKSEVNNRAKRQLIRAIRRLVKNNSYPNDAPIAALDLAGAFGKLQENDEATETLLSKSLVQLEKLLHR